jgi:hypothetical protein
MLHWPCQLFYGWGDAAVALADALSSRHLLLDARSQGCKIVAVNLPVIDFYYQEH